MYFNIPLALDVFIFIFVFLCLYIASRNSIQALYLVFHRLFHNDFIASSLIALIFFPGTVIHELSHFCMAIFLLLPVHKLSLLPQRKGNSLRLGYVLYEKKDILRGILVGIAPIIVGLLLLWWLYAIEFFHANILSIQLLKAYMMFVLTSTMFSSQQDLVDIGYLIPFIIVLVILFYIFNINILVIFQHKSFVEAIQNFMYSVTIYSSISLGIHIMTILICRSIIRLLHIH